MSYSFVLETIPLKIFFKDPINIILKCSELYVKCLKMLGLRGAAPDPAKGATAHPRPPSLSPRTFADRHLTIDTPPSSMGNPLKS